MAGVERSEPPVQETGGLGRTRPQPPYDGFGKLGQHREEPWKSPLLRLASEWLKLAGFEPQDARFNIIVSVLFSDLRGNPES